MQQKVKMTPPKEEPPSRCVSIFSPAWGISVRVKTVDLSKLILKKFKKKKHEQYVFLSYLFNFNELKLGRKHTLYIDYSYRWRMKNGLAEMKTATTPHFIRTYKEVPTN